MKRKAMINLSPNSKVIAWVEELRKYHKMIVTKVHTNTFQGEAQVSDDLWETVKGVSRYQAWKEDEFLKLDPEEYYQLFPDKKPAEEAVKIQQQPEKSEQPEPQPIAQVKKEWISPEEIKTQDGTQCRVWEDTDKIAEYAEKMVEDLWEWEREPLPVVFWDDGNQCYWAGDCHHRTKAAIVAKADSIYVEVRTGGLREAILFSVRANDNHGVPLTARDRRKQAEMMLDQLESMEPEERVQLAKENLTLTEQELQNLEKSGEWSSRLIARYLRFSSSGYATVNNIVNERWFKGKLKELEIEQGQRFKQKSDGRTATISRFLYYTCAVILHWDFVGEDGNYFTEGIKFNEFTAEFEKADEASAGNQSQQSNNDDESDNNEDEENSTQSTSSSGSNGSSTNSTSSSSKDDDEDEGDDKITVSPDEITIAVISNADILTEEHCIKIWDVIADRIGDPIDMKKLTSNQLKTVIKLANDELESRSKPE